VITVHDNKGGLKPHQLEQTEFIDDRGNRITKKAVFKRGESGTGSSGTGLAIVNEIVTNELHGSVDVDNEPFDAAHLGAKFTITI